MKKRLTIILVVTLILFLFLLIISTSYENIYIYKDQYILLENNKGLSEYRIRTDNKEETGHLEIIEGKITFILEKENVATATYNAKTKELIITGKLNNTKYNKTKFKQVSTLSEYFKTVF